jgi:hypothetical protein
MVFITSGKYPVISLALSNQQRRHDLCRAGLSGTFRNAQAEAFAKAEAPSGSGFRIFD